MGNSRQVLAGKMLIFKPVISALIKVGWFSLYSFLCLEIEENGIFWNIRFSKREKKKIDLFENILDYLSDFIRSIFFT